LRKHNIRWFFFGLSVIVLLGLLWLRASVIEWRYGRRLFPWSAYAWCGQSVPETLPDSVRIGLYEEFPVPWRLNKLEQVDFPVTLAVAAASRAEFLELCDEIAATYPQVREVYFWPVLSHEEGYYTGAWSDPDGVRRLAGEANGLPVMWDSEMPLGQAALELGNWWSNRTFLDRWFKDRQLPTHVWRSHTSMGLDPVFLRLVALHFDPLRYATVSLHLDLYMRGTGAPEDTVYRILQCGVERYGERFIPSLGVLNDHEGPEDVFVPVETLRRNLELARKAGVAEVWLFGLNGLDEEVLSALRETMPLETLPGGNAE
jgi:hypothetical protein